MFMVMELRELNCKKLLDNAPSVDLGEDEITCILYNQLCTLNFLHSAGIIHTNVSPSCFLIDSQCTVMMCDFSNAIIKPTDCNKVEQNVNDKRDELYKIYVTDSKLENNDKRK